MTTSTQLINVTTHDEKITLIDANENKVSSNPVLLTVNNLPNFTKKVISTTEIIINF
jgi:hypothetical protein